MSRQQEEFTQMLQALSLLLNNLRKHYKHSLFCGTISKKKKKKKKKKKEKKKGVVVGRHEIFFL